ncbi:unnamed protein product, partial [Rotaria magnacalcarata]
IMLKIIRNIVVCQQTNIFRLNSCIRPTSSLQQKRKEPEMTGTDLLLDPNLIKAFEKIKKGDFVPPFIDHNSLQPDQKFPSMDMNTDSNSSLSKREQLREKTLGKLIYIGKLDKPFRAAKSLSLASSIGGAICYPVMLP